MSPNGMRTFAASRQFNETRGAEIRFQLSDLTRHPKSPSITEVMHQSVLHCGTPKTGEPSLLCWIPESAPTEQTGASREAVPAASDLRGRTMTRNRPPVVQTIPRTQPASSPTETRFCNVQFAFGIRTTHACCHSTDSAWSPFLKHTLPKPSALLIGRGVGVRAA